MVVMEFESIHYWTTQSEHAAIDDVCSLISIWQSTSPEPCSCPRRSGCAVQQNQLRRTKLPSLRADMLECPPVRTEISGVDTQSFLQPPEDSSYYAWAQPFIRPAWYTNAVTLTLALTFEYVVVDFGTDRPIDPKTEPQRNAVLNSTGLWVVGIIRDIYNAIFRKMLYHRPTSL